MPAPLSPEVMGRILTLKGQNKSASIVRKELLDLNIDVSRRAINRVWKKKLIGGPELSEKIPGIKRRKRKTVRTPEVIRKVRQMIKSDNPATQKEMGRRLEVCQQRISEVINEDLRWKRLKKQSAKYLTEAMVTKRKKRAKNFKEKIEGEQLEFILTLDEAMLPHDHKNGETEHYYAPKNAKERDRSPPLATSAQKFPEQHMMAAGFTWRGATRLYIVPARAKVNADYFIERILRPMFALDVPRLFGKKASKVLLHMDSVTSHTARKTVNWLNYHGINFITKEEWLPNSPELAPMDYFANGYLKRMLKKRKYTTGRGMTKAAKEEWLKIPLKMFQNALLAWPGRVQAVHKAKGRRVAL